VPLSGMTAIRSSLGTTGPAGPDEATDGGAAREGQTNSELSERSSWMR